LIIDWLYEVTENLKLQQRTLYHAISILDQFLSFQQRIHSKDMDQTLVMLQALSCLFISAKNYEMDPTVPSSRKFLSQLPGYKPTNREKKREEQTYQYSLGKINGGVVTEKFDAQKNELCEQEQYILNLIGFGLDNYPIFFDIAEIFMAMGILYTTDFLDVNGELKQLEPSKEAVTLLEKYFDYFQLLSLQDHKLVNTNQYLISCSIVSACRKHCGLNPVWTPELI
jgi:hypothetical protein